MMGKVQTAMIFPLSSCLNISAMLPGPRVNGVDPAIPVNIRKTINIGKLIGFAHARLKRINPSVLT